MSTIKHDKLQRLSLDLEQARGEIQALSRLYDEARQEAQFQTLHLGSGVSPYAQQFWRAGDDPTLLLELTGEVAEGCRAEIIAARDIAATRQRMAALQSRIQALQPDANSLAALVAACERFVRESR